MAWRVGLPLRFRHCLRFTGVAGIAPLSIFCGLSAFLSNMPEASSGRITVAVSEAKPVFQLSLQNVAKGHRSGVPGPLQTVARNQADWAALWKKHTSIESNPPRFEKIDFGKEIVVAVFAGEKPTGGHGIEITSVERIDERLLVSFVERNPPPGSVVTQAFTQPFHIVRVATQSSGIVSFRRLP